MESKKKGLWSLIKSYSYKTLLAGALVGSGFLLGQAKSNYDKYLTPGLMGFEKISVYNVNGTPVQLIEIYQNHKYVQIPQMVQPKTKPNTQMYVSK